MVGLNRFSGRRIVVVEDSRTQAEYLCHLLELEGALVVAASAGEEALAAIRNNPPDIVLTDIVMPGMDGYELCHTIKSDPTTAGIPVILVTQLHDPSDVLKGLVAGAENFIVKPYDPEQVHSRIASAFDAKNTPDPDGQRDAFEYILDGQLYTITFSRSRILDVLLSTYEFAIKKNTELQEAHEHMTALNEELMAAVEDLQQANRNLSTENAERGRVERALANANRKLNLMTSVTRHDINNQILSLHGYIELAEMEVQDAKVIEYIGKAKAAAQKIQRQIAFTKQYEDIGVKAPRWQDLATAIDPLRQTLVGESIELVTRDLHYEIYADPLFSRVFENLADNSIRHGKQVRRITISAERSLDGGLLIMYEDDGGGVDEAEKTKIFEKGFGRNTGLGLFLSREILEFTGISIRENGVPGKGALFEITVPPEEVRKAGSQ
ncbi:hybrid sensor histidine kinase/response regulator [Methanoregula formicica]|uniref:Response regulator containing a CheY-like receiver domain and a GGDEF domain n=1 Tax=Methanoregula formicica (strain DSM 22288 / NBRC 105244 / SMSP) TaxID=593750 RepID=L0HH25_METFS|nr:hybrid sensor histidine kinase/response regulator [Methanoregula formicica]AGB03081.1 response regulator containing a CheY-like receiver domain and a GGDEF domain [Methanoregula formicica SMSP]